MRLLCRIGLHRWTFSTDCVDDPWRKTHTEVIRARCSREGCVRYGAWSIVHREAHVADSTTPDSPASLA